MFMNLQKEKSKYKFSVGKIIKRKPMNFKHSLVAMIILSLVGFLIQSVIQNGLLSYMHFVYIIYPAVVVLNILPVFLIISFFYFVTERLWPGCIISYVALCILNIANFYKTMFRDEPLKMSDLSLVSEMENITQNYELKLSVGIVVGVLIAATAVVFVIKHLKPNKIKLPVKIIGAMTTLCCMILSYNFIYTNKQLYENIPTFAVEFHDSDMTKHHGALYSFMISAQASTYKMPDKYSDEKVEKILAQHSSAQVVEKEEKINVIAIMGEAFFDVTRGGVVQFENGINPYENYERIKKEGYFGKLIVPGFGGSTESSEFEFLTGVNQFLLDSSMPTAYKTYITQPAYSLVRYFKEEGYRAIAIHPGYGWFYNRNSVYPNLGFDDFINREDMGDNLPQIYGYVEDEFTTGQIINAYLRNYEQNPDMPYFNFTVTIQNHGPYPDHDLGREMIYVRPDNLSDENYHIINNYLNGIKATDKLLGDVCEFAQSREEPVAVLFFGDHLPYLDENIKCFDALGYDISHKTEDGIESKYKVEYLMWSNDAAKKVIKSSVGQVKKGKGPEISANFLASELLDYLGAEKPAFFEFVSSVRESVNVISPHYYKSGDEKSLDPDSNAAEILEKYKLLQYYNLRRYNIDK